MPSLSAEEIATFGLARNGTPVGADAAEQARRVAAEPIWDDLTGRRPLWTRSTPAS